MYVFYREIRVDICPQECTCLIEFYLFQCCDTQMDYVNFLSLVSAMLTLFWNISFVDLNYLWMIKVFLLIKARTSKLTA